VRVRVRVCLIRAPPSITILGEITQHLLDCSWGSFHSYNLYRKLRVYQHTPVTSILMVPGCL